MNTLIEDKIKAFNSIDMDYKAEVLASELLKSGITEEHLQFKNASSFTRSVERDIKSIKLNNEGIKEVIEFELNREGIYDMLPETIFHFNDTKKNSSTQIIDEVKKNRKEEAEARRFFLPFENEFYIKRLYLELQQQFFLKFDSVDSNRLLFESLYYNSSKLSDFQILSLLYIIPLANKIRADIEKTQFCLAKLIGLPIEVFYSQTITNNYISNTLNGLGYSLLGVNTIAGDSVSTVSRNYVISISSIPMNKLELFMQEGNNKLFLDCLISLFLPANSNYKLLLEVAKEQNNAYLSTNEIYSCLNYNTYI